jgi:hypothetical protein
MQATITTKQTYHRPFKYPKYVKDSDQGVHVRVFKTTIITNSETNDAKIVNMFSSTLKNIMSNWCNNYIIFNIRQ